MEAPRFVYGSSWLGQDMGAAHLLTQASELSSKELGLCDLGPQGGSSHQRWPWRFNLSPERPGHSVEEYGPSRVLMPDSMELASTQQNGPESVPTQCCPGSVDG